MDIIFFAITMELHCNGKKIYLIFFKKLLTELKNLKHKLPLFNPPLYVGDIQAHYKDNFRSKRFFF